MQKKGAFAASLAVFFSFMRRRALAYAFAHGDQADIAVGPAMGATVFLCGANSFGAWRRGFPILGEDKQAVVKLLRLFSQPARFWRFDRGAVAFKNLKAA